MSNPTSQPQHTSRSLSPPSYQRSSSFTTSSSSSSLLPSRSPLDPPHHSTEPMASSSSFRPKLDRARSSSTGTSSPTSYATTALSTAPTSPVLMPNRHWRQTQNVPWAVSQRHQRRRVSPGGGEEEHTRWLSEDEGSIGVTRPIARRRRRQSSRANEEGDPGDRDRGGPGPNTVGRLSEPRSRKLDGRDVAIAASRHIKSPQRPQVRRAHSYEPPPLPDDMPASTLAHSSVGHEPPRIQDLVPAPTSSARVLGLGLSDLSRQLDSSSTTALSGNDEITSIGAVPDYAAGRGGDGIGGFGMPAASGFTQEQETVKQREREASLLGKLRKILDW